MLPEDFEILYDDGPCLMVLKPGGLLTQAPPGIDSLEVRVKRFLAARDQRTGQVYLGVPHRLDRPVSGVMAFATTVRAARRIAEQFEGRTAEKQYWALVEGNVEPDVGTWTDYVRKVPGRARAETVGRDQAEGRLAVLHYQVLQRRDQFSWLQIELETGRTHQVRVQAATRGCPVLGDTLYGSTFPFGPPTSDERLRWIALHGRCLTIRHPVTRQTISVTAPLPEPWQQLGVFDVTGRSCP